MIACIVEPAYDGTRVYDVLRQRLRVSDGCVRRAKQVDGGVRVDGMSVRVNEKVRAGQTVALAYDAPGLPGSATDMEPEFSAVRMLHVDAGLLVVDKPAGIVMYPSPGHARGTLANRVAGWLKARGMAGGLQAVHRLDAGTSGIAVFARHSLAKERLQQQLHTGAFAREYLAVCSGWLEADVGTIDAPLGKVSTSPNAFGVVPDGKPALTRFWVVRRLTAPDGSRCSLVRVRLETGRTHQIRIHFSHAGHPLVGDETYGAASALIARPALHSHHVALAHPITGARIVAESPLPPDMQALVL